ncbi:MAG: N-acetyltransferase [Ruminococcaceae bacterium]|nr:N-acetyltransferase [Oscillospiraceae bacterium]
MSDLIIRHAGESDIPRILEIYAPYIQNTTYSFEYDVPTTEAFTERFRRITAFYPWLVAELDGKVVGYAYGSRMFERAAYSWDADTSVYVDDRYHKMKIGTKLYNALEKELFKMGICNLYAIVTGENDRSRAFHEKCGYIQEAKLSHTGYKFGRWLDIYWYVKHIREGEPGEMPHPAEKE